MTRWGSRHQFESYCERRVQFPHFLWAEPADKSGQDGFGQARQLVAIDGGVVFQALICSNIILSRNSEPLRKHWRTNDRRKVRLDQPVSAHDHIHPLPFWIERVRLWNQIQVAALHLIEVCSVLKYVFDFPFKIFRVGIHDLEVARASIVGRGKLEITSPCAFHKPRTVGIGLVDLGQQFFREQN